MDSNISSFMWTERHFDGQGVQKLNKTFIINKGLAILESFLLELLDTSLIHEILKDKQIGQVWHLLNLLWEGSNIGL